MAANECIPLFEPGGAISAKATAAVTGKRFVQISGDPDNSNFPGLESDADVATATTGGNQLKFAHCPAGDRADGVSSYDAPNGGHFYVLNRDAGTIVPVTADGAISAGQEIEVGATGKAKTLAAGERVGVAVADAADGADCYVKLLI